ncbi:MAG: phosphotransferase family protein, partial [Clostridia bacterium]|nr:phosphotransferase family protein [Clostridia bacterium]
MKNEAFECENQVKELLIKVFNTSDYSKIERMGGLTNRTYRVTMNGQDYVVRIPGEGTEELINRNDEMVSTRLACKLGVDAEMLYFGPDGSKVTRYIENAVTMSSETLKNEENIKRMAEIFKKVHSCGENTGL